MPLKSASASLDRAEALEVLQWVATTLTETAMNTSSDHKP
jgi:hypothetical protein